MLTPKLLNGLEDTIRFDVLIIGGGPAGAMAALLLAKAGWSVAVAEKKTFPRRKVCGEFLSASSLDLLDYVGVVDRLVDRAGPEVRRIELIWKDSSIISEIPYPAGSRVRWGRAIRREILDTTLLDQAKRYGVAIQQPCSVIATKRVDNGFISHVRNKLTKASFDICSLIVIAAHGSWDIGNLPTQPHYQSLNQSDFLAFKVYVEDSPLPDDVMNMLVIPGGYAGMVNCDNGLTSLSCCLRRDYVNKLRRDAPGSRAGTIVHSHILESCNALRPILLNSKPHGEWLAAGPIRPGIRHPFKNGIFSIGNAAGEAHPTIADGISMAMQSAWLLSIMLGQKSSGQFHDIDRIGREFAHAWRRTFRARILAADSFAKMCLLGRAHRVLLPLVKAFPQMLTLGAKLGGIGDEINWRDNLATVK